MTRGFGARRAVGAAVLAQFSVAVSEQGIPSLTGFLQQALALSAFGTGLVVAAILIGEVLGSYGAGSLADVFGGRLVMSTGAVAGGLMVIIASLLPLHALVAFLVAGGVCISAVMPAGARLIREGVPPSRLGFGIGLRQAAVPVGGLAAALVLPIVAATWGWREALFIAGALTAAGGAMSMLVLGGWRARTEATRPSEARPALRLGWSLRLATAWACLMVTGQWVATAFIALYVHEKTGYSLALAGVFLALAQAGGIAGRVGWGWAGDRFYGNGLKSLLLLLSILGALAAAAFALVPDGAPGIVFAVLALVGGLTLIGWPGVWVTFVSGLEGGDRAGRSLGFALTFVNLAAFTAPPAYGLIADATGSFRVMWLVAASVIALSVVPLLLIRESPAGGLVPERVAI